MKKVFFLIFVLITTVVYCQDDIEFKLYNGSDCPDCTPPMALNLNQVKSEGVYPDSAKVNKIQGLVKVQLSVDKLGNIEKIDYITGFEIFYPEVTRLSLKIKFTPCYKNNKAIKCKITVPFRFRIPQEKRKP